MVVGTKGGDVMDDDDVGGVEPPSHGEVSFVSCSICLDLVTDNGERSRAKLQCGHEFHLDCIGSAFNMKGAMQCPNCRKIERGRWLFANGSARSFPEFSMDDWTPDEETYDFNYSEMPFRVHWCPFSGFTQVRSSFEEVESPSTTHHDLQGHHAILSEHAAASSAAHSYVAYFRPIPPTHSNSSESVDDLNFNHHWNSLSAHSEIFSSHAFPAIDIQYQSWGHHSPPFSPTSSHINGAEQAPALPAALRSMRGESDAMTRSGSFLHPLLFGPGSGHRAGSAFVSSIVPNHPGNSVLRTYERIHISHALPHQHPPPNSPGMSTSIVPGVRRFNGPRALPPVVPAASQSDHSAGFYIFPPSGASIRNIHEAENPSLNHFHAWDSGWGPFHQATGGSDSGSRSSSFWRHWS